MRREFMTTAGRSIVRRLSDIANTDSFRLLKNTVNAVSHRQGIKAVPYAAGHARKSFPVDKVLVVCYSSPRKAKDFASLSYLFFTSLTFVQNDK